MEPSKRVGEIAPPCEATTLVIIRRNSKYRLVDAFASGGSILMAIDCVCLEIIVCSYRFRTVFASTGSRYNYKTFGEGILKQRKGGLWKSDNPPRSRRRGASNVENHSRWGPRSRDAALHPYRPGREALFPIPRSTDIRAG